MKRNVKVGQIYINKNTNQYYLVASVDYKKWVLTNIYTGWRYTDVADDINNVFDGDGKDFKLLKDVELAITLKRKC